ncbi:hypothetical protein EPI10_030771 [Gossypium australe]|uniref:Uncharacterized protein n=1 Tax=Gossypium australe TaxID=47621 RepID=A0A5B6X1E5_9ROSI|nr:hypothetical protein EPI10_030771 [Gossypium australe]
MGMMIVSQIGTQGSNSNDLGILLVDFLRGCIGVIDGMHINHASHFLDKYLMLEGKVIIDIKKKNEIFNHAHSLLCSNMSNMSTSKNYFDRSELSSSNIESNNESKMSREATLSSLMSLSSQRNVLS